MFASFLSVLSLIALCSANPMVFKREEPKEVHCGTTADATFSDCEALVNDPAIWNAAFNNYNYCTFSNVLAGQVAYLAENVACHGDCCVYHTDHNGGTRDTFDLAKSEQTRLNAQTLLGCGNRDSNSINVMGKFDWTYVCLSNGKGCGDCFDDADFAF